jgi:acylphosphatase
MVEGRASLHALVHGRVHGVYFRAYVLQHGQSLGLAGYVRNIRNPMAVEVEAEGERAGLEILLQRLHEGPPGAWVERVDAEWGPYQGRFTDFEIR